MTFTKTKFDFLVRLAVEHDTLSITNIWRECFTNDMAYIENFITNCLPFTKTWVAIPENSTKAVAVLSLLPSYAISNGRKLTGGYVYGVATLPGFRGNSISKLLMEAAIQYCTAQNYNYMVVKPANEGLFDLYMRQSFDILVNKSIFTVETTPHPQSYKKYWNDSNNRIYKDSDFCIDKLYNLRQNNDNGTMLLWPSEILKYAISDIKYKGGDIHFITDIINNRELYFIECPLENSVDSIKVIECNAKEEREIFLITSNIKSRISTFKNVVFEVSFDSFPSFSALKVSSALIKLIDNTIPVEEISKVHLSLPME
jgi:ribosomal protein S18 acetylase RimI-like enzyme